MRWYIVFLLLITLSGTARERYVFSNISLESGLSQITVICIHQDKQGFMWFGTRNGLNRYDGYGFDVFLTNPDDPSSISDNHILSIAEEPDGKLWVGTNHGLNRFDPEKGSFTRYFFHAEDHSSISHNIIQSLRFDSTGQLWIGTNHGLNRYDPETDSFIRYDLNSLLNDNPICALFPEGDKLYIGTMFSGLIIYDLITKKHKVLNHDSSDPGSIGHDYVRAIFFDKNDNLWIGTHHNGVSFRRKGEQNFQTLNRASGLTNDYVRAIAQGPQGEIIVGTFNGLNVIDPSTLEIEQYHTYGASPGDLTHYSIYSIYIDRAETLWIGSYAGGIDYYNRYGQKFKFYDLRRHEQGIFGLLGPLVETEEYLYITSEGSGIIEFEKETETFKHYPVAQNDDTSYARNIIKTLYLDGSRLICGSNLGVVYSFDLHTRQYRVLYDTGVEDPIYYLGRNSRGELMIGGVNDPVGLIILSPDGRVTDHFPVNGQEDVQFPNVRCVLEIKKDRYLIGTRNEGLFDYNRDQQRLIQYKHIGENYNTSMLPENYISTLYQDGYGTIWVGTFGGGFSQFDPTTGMFSTYSTRNGLMNNNICTIVEDLSENLWMSTISGVSEFNPKTEQFINYTHNNGVQIDEFTPHAGKRLTNGHIIFCGNNGAVIFDPASMNDNPFVPPIVLRNLYLNNNRILPNDETGILPSDLNSQSEIVLSHNQSNFSIEFSALNYIFPERNQYAYKLEGFDTDWNEVGSRRMAYYTNISPGKYRFIVRGSNNDGVWNNEYRSFHITILSPLWQRWWAYVIYFLVIIGIIGLIIRYYLTWKHLENDIKLKQAEARVQTEFHEARDKLFTNFSHELRTPLTLIMSPLDDMIESPEKLSPEKTSNSLRLMQGNARRLLRLVNNLMDFQKKEHGRLQLRISEGDFIRFAREMTEVFPEVARTREISLELTSNVEILTYWFDKNLMEKVFFNYLSNAFKNTPNGGQVWVRIDIYKYKELQQMAPDKMESFTNKDIPYILFEIADSGEGIPTDELENIFQPFYQVAQNEYSASGTGLGLSLSKSIVEMHRGIIWAESPVGSGAIFRTILPVDQSLYGKEEWQTRDIEKTSTGNLVDSEARQQNILHNTPETAFRKGKKKYTVLVVEDHIDVRKYIVSHLEETYHLLEAANGIEAVEKSLNHLPDLVITDRMMPRMDGMQVVETLKEDIRTSHIPIIVITAKALTEDIKEGYRIGADDYIAKPFNASLLVERVANLIASREKLKALYGKRFSLESMGVEATSVDERFMNKLYALLEERISDPEFSLDIICREIGMSRANLYRKIKAITNVAPNNFIRNFRLEMGAKMLSEARMSVSDVYVAVGFSSHAYFTNCFKTLYGISPTEYALRNGSNSSDIH